MKPSGYLVRTGTPLPEAAKLIIEYRSPLEKHGKFVGLFIGAVSSSTYRRCILRSRPDIQCPDRGVIEKIKEIYPEAGRRHDYFAASKFGDIRSVLAVWLSGGNFVRDCGLIQSFG
ncbi:hypothetical protein [Paenibacillus faecalis]|uniref:hypothetical protein n=1 Tax=Paenibacillus faecalis TaxID=2079532 RepID=UPI000D1144CC|nr:hypothetical protein [Paenibacillus faecalis]